MATMNFQPGGAEDDDDFDEDGFYIGDSNFKKLNQREPLDPVLVVIYSILSITYKVFFLTCRNRFVHT